jgi:hypothetical protein
VPETKEEPLEQIEEHWRKRNSQVFETRCDPGIG